MIPYRVRHETMFSYSDPVSISHNVAHLLPRATASQRVHQVELIVEPTPTTVRAFDDYFGNPAAFFIVDQPHDRLRVLAESIVEIDPPPRAALAASPSWEDVVETLRAAPDANTMAAYEYVFDSPLVQTSAELARFAGPSFPAGRPVLEGALDLCRRIHREFRYDTEATTLATPVHEALEQRHGVCQDFAQVMIGALRSLGLAARYVSGYIRSRSSEQPDDHGASDQAGTAPGGEPSGTDSGTERADEPAELVGADASHAWVSFFCPRAGWIDFDPTNDMIPSDRHVVIAWGRDYDDVSPLQGVTLGGGLQTVKVGVAMEALEEAPGAG